MRRKVIYSAIFTIAATIVAFLFSNTAHAAITLQLKTIAVIPNGEINVDTQQFPYFKINIKAQLNGSDVTLSAANIVILEGLRPSQPNYVSPLQQGWQTVTWLTKREEFGLFNNITIVAAYQNEVAVAGGMFADPDVPNLIFKDVDYTQFKEIYFGITPAGKQKIRQMFVVAPNGRHDSHGNEMLVRIDSLRTNTRFFTYNWQGHPISKQKPPCYLQSGFHYLVDIMFKPDEDKFYTDNLTVYFEGGASKKIKVYGNHFPIESNTVLKLLSPNGGELFAPCDQFKLQWEGSSPLSQTIIEFSSDGGL